MGSQPRGSLPWLSTTQVMGASCQPEVAFPACEWRCWLSLLAFWQLTQIQLAKRGTPCQWATVLLSGNPNSLWIVCVSIRLFNHMCFVWYGGYSGRNGHMCIDTHLCMLFIKYKWEDYVYMNTHYLYWKGQWVRLHSRRQPIPHVPSDSLAGVRKTKLPPHTLPAPPDNALY